jgi:hypothetical protein
MYTDLEAAGWDAATTWLIVLPAIAWLALNGRIHCPVFREG